MQLKFVLLDVLGASKEPPSAFRMFRAGVNETLKGKFLFDDKAAASVKAAAADWGVELSIDYGHGMFALVTTPESGIAAGWFKPEIRDGELWATDVRWTERAAAFLRTGEYRYVSPSFDTDEENRVTALLNVALTNIPATKRADPLVSLSLVQAPGVAGQEESNSMKGLLILLGLAETASEADAVNALRSKLACSTELLSVTGKATDSEALGTVRAWKVTAGEFEKLSAQHAKTRAEMLSADIEKAVGEGRLAPALREWAREYGAKDESGLRAFLSAAPVIVPLERETKAPEKKPGETVTLSADEEKVIKQLGITREQYIAANASSEAK